MNLGTSIKLLRKLFDLSQEQLSEKTGISQTSISQIESGKKSPSKKTIAVICKVLEVPEAVLYIIGMEDSDVPKSRKQMFDAIYPEIKELAIQIIGSRKGKLLK